MIFYRSGEKDDETSMTQEEEKKNSTHEYNDKNSFKHI
jgi:hypothetical protein